MSDPSGSSEDGIGVPAGSPAPRAGRPLARIERRFARWLFGRSHPGSRPTGRRADAVGIVSLSVLAVCLFAFGVRSRHLPGSSVVPDALFGYSVATLTEFLTLIGESGRRLYAFTQLSLDVLFPLAYASFLAVAIRHLWGDAHRLWRLPMLAALLDLLENVSLATLALLFREGMPLDTVLTGLVAGLTIGKLWLVVTSLLLLGRVFGPRAGSAAGTPPPVLAYVQGPLWVVMLGLLLSQSVLAAVPVVGMAIVLHRRRLYLFQYLYFARFVLLGAAGLLLFPMAADTIASGHLLGNLFVAGSWHGDETAWLRWLGPGGLSLVVSAAFAGMLAMTLMWCARLVVLTAAARCELPLARADHGPLGGKPARDAPADAQASYRRSFVEANRRFVSENAPALMPVMPILFLLLASPFLFGLWRRSGQSWRGAAAVGLGAALSLASSYLVRSRRAEEWWRRVEASVKRFAPYAADLLDPGKPPLGIGGQGHGPLLAYVGLLLAAYLVLGVALDPASRSFPDGFPAVVFVLLIGMVVVWALSMSALLLDRSRVPVLAATLVGLLLLAQIAAYDDTYFEVFARAPDAGPLPNPTQVIRAWAARHEAAAPDYVTVVAASGGGIKASLWTARVMQELLAPPPAGAGKRRAQLRDSIVLLSTNSGGSVGGMYVTDAFTKAGPPGKDALERIVVHAGASSLTACARAMAYRDLLHFASGGAFPCWSVTHDRGWAMDRRWERRRADMPEAAARRRLADWAEGVRGGWRPAHLFNATVVESGASFRFGSVDLGNACAHDAPGSQPQEWCHFLPRADVDVATAARLSATFPWVSPMARPWAAAPPFPEDAQAINARAAFRLADGGYFDNFGVFSAIEFLRKVDRGEWTERRIRGVLFIEIRATPEGPSKTTEGGIRYSLFGPIGLMNSVRNSSQIARNDVERGLFEELWRHRSVEVVPVSLDLVGPGPLSWHLSTEEAENVRRGWDAANYWRLENAVAALDARLR